MTHNLSLLVITKAEPFAFPFLTDLLGLRDHLDAELVIAADGEAAERTLRSSALLAPFVYRVDSRGFLESVHDEAVGFTTGRYVLRLDDDERASRAMTEWLKDRRYEAEPHWKFARAHLWGDRNTVLVTPQLWPDHQTRLSKRELMLGRDHIHAGSPHGGGAEASVVIEHWKFLVKSRAERAHIADRYERIQAGSGRGGMLAFNLPEEKYSIFPTCPLGAGWAEEVKA